MSDVVPVLRVDGLAVVRDATEILGDVSWRVEAGEHWVIMGPNGSGKTSLLNVLTGYLAPTRGTLDVLGQRFGRSDWRDLRRRVGVVTTAIDALMPPGEPGKHVVLSGREAIIGHHGAARAVDVERAGALLTRIECEHLADRPWRVLSQGERQRLLIARALMPDPALLVLDEPCAGLDPVARERFLALVSRLTRATRPALVLVTHHVEEIVDGFTHALVLDRGRVCAGGRIEQVLSSATLSALFGVRVQVTRRASRWAIELKLLEKPTI